VPRPGTLEALGHGIGGGVPRPAVVVGVVVVVAVVVGVVVVADSCS